MRQKEEVDYLQRRIKEMKGKLVELKQEHGTKRALSTPWENEARVESLKRQKAEQENALLKKSLQEQMDLAQQLQAVLTKRPNLSLFPFIQDAEWKLYRLVTDPTKRVEAMHAIADREYERLESVLLETGVESLSSGFNGMRINDGDVLPADSLTQTTFETGSSTGIEVELQQHHTFPDLPYKVLSDAYWRVFRGQSTPALPIKELEIINEDLIYVEALCDAVMKYGGSLKQSNLVMKRYREKNRDIIIWRGILQDDKNPLVDGSMRCADSGWFVIEDHSNRKTDQVETDLKLVLRVRPPIPSSKKDEPVGVVIEAIVGTVLENSARIAGLIQKEVEETVRASQLMQTLEPP